MWGHSWAKGRGGNQIWDCLGKAGQHCCVIHLHIHTNWATFCLCTNDVGAWSTYVCIGIFVCPVCVYVQYVYTYVCACTHTVRTYVCVHAPPTRNPAMIQSNICMCMYLRVCVVVPLGNPLSAYICTYVRTYVCTYLSCVSCRGAFPLC